MVFLFFQEKSEGKVCIVEGAESGEERDAKEQ